MPNSKKVTRPESVTSTLIILKGKYLKSSDYISVKQWLKVVIGCE